MDIVFAAVAAAAIGLACGKATLKDIETERAPINDAAKEKLLVARFNTWCRRGLTLKQQTKLLKKMLAQRQLPSYVLSVNDAETVYALVGKRITSRAS